MTKIANTHTPYERRQIIAKCGNAGNFTIKGKLFKIPEYMTFYTGKDSPAVCGRFLRPADTDERGFLRLEGVREGEIVVDPGFVYQKVQMPGLVILEHLKAMRKFKPSEVVEYVKDEEAPSVNMGSIMIKADDFKGELDG